MEDILKNEILKFENVSGKSCKFGLHNITLSLEPGYIYAICGENGAGKTTLFNYVMKEYSKYDGSIKVCGLDAKKHFFETMNNVGFISEDMKFVDKKSGDENAVLLGKMYKSFDMNVFKEKMGQLNVRRSVPYGNYSRGETMKFQLAFAIAHHPSLYLIDEATAGMDPVFRKEFFDILRKLIEDETAGVLMSSHIMSDVEKQTDYVALMQEGQLSEFVESPDIERLF